MKLNILFSFSLHILLIAAFFLAKPGTRKFEGYPTVIPVEIVELKPVSFQAPEVAKVQPRVQEIKPKPQEELETVTLEKKELPKEEPEPPVKTDVEEPEEKPDEGKSVVGGEKVRLDVEEFPFSYYLALLQSRIQANWEPPMQTRQIGVNKKVLVYFKVQRSGQVTDIVIERTSGDYLFDQAALRAVTLANPLAPLPADYPRADLGVHFEFEQGS